MDSLFKRVVMEINVRSHLQAILPIQPISVLFLTSNEEWVLKLSKEECTYLCRKRNERVEMSIHTSEKALEFLLKGDVRLLQLVKYGEIKVEGSYRHSLLLESILWLCRDYKIA